MDTGTVVVLLIVIALGVLFVYAVYSAVRYVEARTAQRAAERRQRQRLEDERLRLEADLTRAKIDALRRHAEDHP